MSKCPYSLTVSLSILLSISGCSSGIRAPAATAENESIITIIGTNDVHGHFLTETPQTDIDEGTAAQATAQPLGGQQWFAGYVSAIRAATRSSGTTLLLDAGDVAQGTLISNSNEGMLAAQLMNKLDYTAAIPGNHAYDFGPIGAQVDQCTIGDSSCDPLAALKRFQKALNFPFLAANVKQGTKTASFLKDYALIPYLGRNIAIIGLDNQGTPATTYRMNVKSLKFTSGIQETTTIVNNLRSQGLADVFILVAHNGDMAGDSPLIDFLNALPKNPDGSPLLDAAIVGHTHIYEQGTQNGIPYIQSLWGGKYFGLVQLYVTQDPTTGKLSVEHDKTTLKAGIPIVPATGSFMGQPVQADSDIAAILSTASQSVDALANQKIGVLQSNLSDAGKRLADSQIGNFVVDVMNSAAGSEVSVIGSGDVRMGIEKRSDGSLLYNDLFNVLPKGLQLVDVPEMAISMLVANLNLSIQTCGDRGALQTSGIKIYFKRNCDQPVNGLDPNAQLVRVVTNSGEVIYPASEAKRTTINVSTTDFILTGGAGYTKFMSLIATPAGIQSLKTMGPMRDLMIQRIGAMGTITSAPFAPGRYVNCSDTANASLTECQ